MVHDDEDLFGSIRYLDLEDLTDLNRALIQLTTPDEQSGVFNEGGLSSAQQRPAQKRYYEQTNDLLLLGAYLFTGLIWNHPFRNANKRTAFAACRIFLLLNGALFDPPADEVLEIARGIVEHDYDEAQVASWISWYTRPIDCADYLQATGDTLSVLGSFSAGTDNE